MLFLVTMVICMLAMILLIIGLAGRPPRHCGKQACDCLGDRPRQSCDSSQRNCEGSHKSCEG